MLAIEYVKEYVHDFFRRLFAFPLVQLGVEVLFLAIIAVLISLLVPPFHLPQLTWQIVEEGILFLGVGVAAMFLARPLLD